MPTAPAQCANHALNQAMCPCRNTTCANHGICCECLLAHRAAGSLTACMRGAERSPATLDLARQAATLCATNGSRNQTGCPCSSVSCANRGVCCNCVRNHFTVDGRGRVACMRF